MTDTGSIDPDALLRAITREESRSKTGKLRLFFGMAAGVGKTYAMLKAAQEAKEDGADLVVAVVETHGRAETNRLLQGLEIIPRKKIQYRDVALEEMDIDAVLARKPTLALVDELAHTNVPGSRHPKRWQDVIELLDAGIDVFTTLNVQHIESRKEAVEAITGITIRETVPDSLLERANQITLIDITPSELLERLSEGKIYLGERAEKAAENFFKEDKLTALRELALRLTAEKVDHELQGMMSSNGSPSQWKTSERLMVAISHSPLSQKLIRATRRISFSLEASWIAVHVDTGATLSPEENAQLTKNLSLARELGGEVVTTTDMDIASALKRIARQRNITQLIVGRPTRRWFRDTLHGGTLLEQLARERGTFDLHVLRSDETEIPTQSFKASTVFEAGPLAYAAAIGIILAIALISSLFVPIVGYRAVGFLLLLGVLGLSLFVSMGPIITSALLSALIWDYFFIPPFGTFHISEPDDIVMCLIYLCAAGITGTLTHRIRARERMLRLREQRTETLYEVAQILANRQNRAAFLPEVMEEVNRIMNANCSVLCTKPNGELDHLAFPPLSMFSQEKELAVAEWAFRNSKPAGRSTDTLPSANGLYLPLIGKTSTVGVLAFFPIQTRDLHKDEENLLQAITQQLAVTLERELFHEQSLLTERLQESERLHQTILDSVSHELRTPMTAISGAAAALQHSQTMNDITIRNEIVQQLIVNAERLNRVVSNLLDMSRLSSGTYTLKTDWHDINDVIAVTLDASRVVLSEHKVITKLGDALPLVKIDHQLFEQALSNLLVNAALYTPSGTHIEIATVIDKGMLKISVCDNGPGIAPDALPNIFDKFYRVPGTPAGGSGLGLAIVKGIIEAHHGTVEAANCPEGGACFTIRITVDKQPHLPQEKEVR